MSDIGEGDTKERQGETISFTQGSAYQTGVGTHKQQDIQSVLPSPLILSIFDAAPDALLISDELGRIVLANQQAEHLLGYSPAELLGRPVEDLIPELYRPNHPALRAGFIKGSSPRLMGRGRILQALRKDESECAVEVSLGRVITDHGVFVATGLRDISARTAFGQALQESEQRYLDPMFAP